MGTTNSALSTNNTDNNDASTTKKEPKMLDLGLGDLKNENIDDMFHKYDHLKPSFTSGLASLAGIKPPPIKLKSDEISEPKIDAPFSDIFGVEESASQNDIPKKNKNASKNEKLQTIAFQEKDVSLNTAKNIEENNDSVMQ